MLSRYLRPLRQVITAGIAVAVPVTTVDQGDGYSFEQTPVHLGVAAGGRRHAGLADSRHHRRQGPPRKESG